MPTAKKPDDRQFKADDIHLQFDSIVVLNHSANDSLDLAVVQVDADFVAAHAELSVVWLLD